MIRRSLSAIAMAATLIAMSAPVRGYSFQYELGSGIAARRWVTSPIIIALSTSLNSPPPNIKASSDVVGAARRALQRWTDAADIQFVEIISAIQTISPSNAGDGISLLTVSADNATAFRSVEGPGRTRTFYDSGGAIVEADIALNPHELFSSDGTPGTYDLEAAFAHEIGHLLGLEHSAVIGATMQPRQAKNGLYNLPAFTQRSLSDDDYAGAVFLYGTQAKTGSVSGKLVSNEFERVQTVFGGHIFAEDVVTGRVVAASVTQISGDYHLAGLAPGAYRLILQTLNGPVAADDIASSGGLYSGLTQTTPSFRSSFGMSSTLSQIINVSANSALELDLFIFPHPAPSLKPRVIGMNEELSTVALPVEPGKTFTIYVAGEGVDEVLANSISVSGPFMTVDPASVVLEEFGTPYPVISFNVTVAPDAPAGEYSIRLQLSNGEFAYLAGALTIDPG